MGGQAHALPPFSEQAGLLLPAAAPFGHMPVELLLNEGRQHPAMALVGVCLIAAENRVRYFALPLLQITPQIRRHGEADEKITPVGSCPVTGSGISGGQLIGLRAFPVARWPFGYGHLALTRSLAAEK